MTSQLADTPKRIAFIATRIQGTDGVSLEIEKWAQVLEERMGHTCFYIAGECDRQPDRTEVIPEMHFRHPLIDEINRQAFNSTTRNSTVSRQIHELTWVLKEKLREALEQMGIDLVIAENCVTIPMNLPLGLAVVETIMETGMACIAHHHDFVWERERFMVNAVDDYLRAAFPPMLRQMEHIAINTQAAMEFSRRTGLSCRVIPNVMDFERPPRCDNENRDFRKTIGAADDDILILQPTRIVQRKAIETSIELARQLDHGHCKLVITHASGDEGDAYATRVQRYAELLDVVIIYAEPWINSTGSVRANGQRRFSIWDAYRQADFVSYPSIYEGFGNAFLETIYYKKPILCNRYAIYRTDIEPCGFKPVLMDGFLTDEVITHVRRVLEDEAYRTEMVEHNFKVAERFFSYSRVEAELRAILAKPRLVAPCSSG